METLNDKHPLLYYILNHWIINLIMLFIGSVGVFILVFFVMQKKYTATVTILPPSQNMSMGLSGQMSALASLTGLNMMNSNLQTPEMYKEILLSRRVLETILFEEFEGFDPTGHQYKDKLINMLDIKAKNDREKIDLALRKISKDIVYVDINSESNLLQLSVTLKDPVVSANVANRMVKLLNNIVITQVQFEDRQQLLYIDKHIKYAQDSIKIAEINLQRFLEKVKSMAEPSNQIKELALKRDLELYSTIWIELKQQKEVYTLKSITSLAEVKVLDKAEPPYLKSRPKRILMCISLEGLFLFLLVCFNAVILIWRNIRQEMRLNVPIAQSK